MREAEDRAVLKCLREETTYLILKVRVANQERRKEAELFWNTDIDFDKLEEEINEDIGS
ncbi:MAG: hypothetical protein QXU75_06645 [Candidatus Methanomethylicaceae archaeon]